jgi:hypothetical protein
MKRTTMLATVAMSAVLGSVIATFGLLANQAEASECHIIYEKVKCSNENSFRSQAFNYLGKDDYTRADGGDPYQYKELPNQDPFVK